MQMLIRREHSKLELEQKLTSKNFNIDDIDYSIQLLIKNNYQSDKRFAQEFIQMRFNQGKGPLKITAELKQRGVDGFDLSEFDFFALAKKVKNNKFGINIPTEYKQQAKQKRFLQSRGFSFDQINNAFE